jgi:ATP-dependent exoDNAse (exonuclease V) alpha subunit
VAQVPLILAWAITIHKAQGATLDMAEIDVGSGIFECGQTYVALSRLRSLEGLYLTSFDVDKIRIHSKVKAYYERLLLESSSMMKTHVQEAEEVHVDFDSLPQATATLVPPVTFASFTYCP